MYSDEHVARFIAENFIPARVNVREQAQDFQKLGARYGVEGTPTILELDPNGNEQQRVEGFVDATELLAQLKRWLLTSPSLGRNGATGNDL